MLRFTTQTWDHRYMFHQIAVPDRARTPEQVVRCIVAYRHEYDPGWWPPLVRTQEDGYVFDIGH